MASVSVQTTTRSSPFGLGPRFARAGTRLWMLIDGSSDTTNPGLCLWYSDDGVTWTKHSQVADTSVADRRFDISTDDSDTPTALYLVHAAGNVAGVALTFGSISTNVGSGVPGAITSVTVDAGGTNLGNRYPALFVTKTVTNPRVWIVWSKQLTSSTYQQQAAYASTSALGTWVTTNFTSMTSTTAGSFNNHQAAGCSLKVGGSDRAVIFYYDSDNFVSGSRRWRTHVFDPTVTTPTPGVANDVLITPSGYTATPVTLPNIITVACKDDYIIVGILVDTDSTVTWLKSVDGATWTTPSGWGALTMGAAAVARSGPDFYIIHSATYGVATTTVQTLQYRKVTASGDAMGTDTTFSDNSGNVPAMPRDTGTARISGGYRTATASPFTVRYDTVVLGQTIRPDGTVSSGSWTTAPLHTKLADQSDATVISGVAS